MNRPSVFAIVLTAAIVVMVVMVALAINKHSIDSEAKSKFAMFGVLFLLAGAYEYVSKRMIVGEVRVWNDRRLIWTISTGCWFLCGFALAYKGVF